MSSKLAKALIPGYSGGAGASTLPGPLKGLAPGWNGLPEGLPSGVNDAIAQGANPIGGMQPGKDGTPTFQKGFLDHSSNGTPTPAATGPAYSVWGDPDMTKRGWGWGMGADGALHTGVQGGGPAGTPWGPPGSTAGGLNGYGPPAPGAAPGAAPTAGPQGMSPGQGMQLAQQMRQGGSANTPGMGSYMQSQGGPGMGPGMPQGQPGMGGQPGAPAGAFTAPQQFAPATPGTPGYSPNPQQQQQGGIQALIDQLRQQQPQNAQ